MRIIEPTTSTTGAPATTLVSTATALSWVGKPGVTDSDEVMRINQIVRGAEQYAAKRIGGPIVPSNVVDYYRGWGEGLLLSGDPHPAGTRPGQANPIDVAIRWWNVDGNQMLLGDGLYILDKTHEDGTVVVWDPQQITAQLSRSYSNPVSAEYRAGAALEPGDEGIALECLRGLIVGMDERSTDVVLEDQYPNIDELLDSISKVWVF